jgi:site-specific DNA-cytosine methylase
LGIGDETDPAYTLQANHTHAVAFSAKDYGADATEELSPTLRAGGAYGANGGVMPAVAYAIQDVRGLDKKQNGKGWSDEGVSYTVDTHATQGVAAYPINTQLGLRGPDVSNTSRDGFGVGDETDPAYTLQANHSHAVAFDWKMGAKARSIAINEEQSPTLGSQADRYAVAYDHPGRFNNIHGGSGEHQDVMPTLEATNPKQIVAHAVAFDLRGREGGSQLEGPHDTANIRAASGGSSRSYVAASTVRRLTPVECERLQGFPDNFTAIPWRKKGAEDCPDGPRYKALGNSMAVPVMRWIGERIRLVDDCISII